MAWSNKAVWRKNVPDKRKDFPTKSDQKSGGITLKTQDYRTKTLFLEHKNPSFGGAWGVGIDIGYSGTKIFSPNIVACFPSFAVPVDGSLINISSPDSATILYRDSETGRIWRVGKTAQDNISIHDPDSNTASIYDRQRYFSPQFLVFARTALGIACTKNEFGDPDGKKIYLQTGLPNKYLKSDSNQIVSVLSGEHAFDLKVGSSEWKHYEITLELSKKDVTLQPIGTLLSVATDNNGMATPDAEKIMRSMSFVLDPGFGTMDYFSLMGRELKNDETLTEYSMKRVLEEASEKIYKKYGVEIPVPSFQKYLDLGYVTRFDRKERRGYNEDFADILEECSREIANQAIDKLCDLFDNFLEYNYLVITGGTGEAWYPYFEEALAGIPNLTLVPGNRGTEGFMTDGNGNSTGLPFFFSNARGYYFYLQSRLAKEHRSS